MGLDGNYYWHFSFSLRLLFFEKTQTHQLSVNALWKNKLMLTLAIFLPVKTFACAACYGGNIDSPMADGMNWGIFTLLAVIGTVLLTFLTFLIHIIRKSEALAMAAESAENISKL